MFVHSVAICLVMQVIVGDSGDLIPQLKDRLDIDHVDFVFIDHFKGFYLRDLKLLEKNNLLQPGTVNRRRQHPLPRCARVQGLHALFAELSMCFAQDSPRVFCQRWWGPGGWIFWGEQNFSWLTQNEVRSSLSLSLSIYLSLYLSIYLSLFLSLSLSLSLSFSLSLSILLSCHFSLWLVLCSNLTRFYEVK